MKEYIASEEGMLALVFQVKRYCTSHMTGMIGGDFDGFSILLKYQWIFDGNDFHPVIEGTKIGPAIEGEFGQVQFTTLAFHYREGIGKHSTDQNGAGVAEEKGGLGMKPGKKGEATQMVEVTVGQ